MVEEFIHRTNIQMEKMHMGKITTKKFLDGIAVYEDEKEIAFYSNITKKVRYYNDGKCIECTEILFEKNLVIINLIKKYITDTDESRV